MSLPITFPPSDLLTPAHPYRLDFEAPPGAHGMLTLRHAHTGAQLAHPLTLPPGGGRVSVSIDGTWLAEGEYTGDVALRTPDAAVYIPFACFRMPTPLDAPFPVMVYEAIFTDDPAQWEEALAMIAATGVNVISQHMGDLGRYAPIFDRAARHGLRFMPSDNLHEAHVEPREERLARMNRYDEPEERPWLCMNQPAVREDAAVALARHLDDYRAHPDFSGLVYYGDDLFLRVRYLHGQVGISCYCDTCRADFAARTGLDAPLTTAPAAGIVPDDHPWLQWMRYRCGETFGGFIRALEEAKHGVDPTIRIGMCHGWPQQPFTNVATGIYGPLTQPTAVVSSYAYPYLRSPRVDLICHAAMGAMGQRGKDIWMLGAFNSNMTLYPAWQVYQNYWNMLAAGYRVIGYFSWWDLELARQRGEADAVADELAALTRCNAHGRWVLPVAKHWAAPAAPFAVLYSFATEAFDIEPVNRGHQHVEHVLALQRLALRRGVPLEMIGEEEILDGILDRYSAVCLVDIRALPASVHAVLTDYAARGGTVFVENDLLYCDWDSPAVRVPGALEVSPETMIALLADRQPPAVTVDSPHATARTLAAGAIAYHVFVNNFADQYWGMPFHYDSPALNQRDIALVREAPIDTTVTLTGDRRWLFDATTGEFVGATDSPVPLALEQSWGRVWAALPCPRARLRLDVPADARQAETLAIRLSLRDDANRLIAGGAAAHVTLTAPSGRMHGAGGYVSLVDGEAALALPLGLNEETGAWTLTAEGGFPRETQTRRLTVRESTTRPAWARVEDAV